MSHVKVSFDVPEYTANIDGIGTLRLLESIRTSGYSDKIRFYQASTSELYGKVREIPQSETTPFYPRSPYACAKLLLTGLLSTTEKHIIYTRVMEFYLIMRVPEEEKHS